jgi:hypothetical protein
MTPTDLTKARITTALERAQQARIEELERRLAEMEAMYDKVAADLIEALDVASAYRATASTLHQEVERRNGVERRQHTDFGAALRRIEDARDAGRTNAPERRKSWPR